MKTTFVVPVLSVALAMPAFGKTYKSPYPLPCSEVWPAVKATLSNPENYEVKETDDVKMHADYAVKHSAHVNISGTLLQRTNHVTLVPNGAACEMQVVSNYSGWEHNDRDDFKTRVDEALARQKNSPAEPSKAPGTPQ